jgi:hypothetical protein
LKHREAQMTEKDQVLSANLEFYRAFAMRDEPAMEALWAHSHSVTCIHPGWMALRGRDAVMRSWGDILGNPEAPRIMCHDEAAVLYGNVAVVTCEEMLPSSTLVATNIFAKEGGVWRMIHHQAGPLLVGEGRSPPSRNRLN